MSIDIEKLTDRDIRKFKKEMQGYEKSKKIFFILGFVFMGLTILLVVAAILFGIFAAKAGAEMDDLFSYEYFAVFLSLSITSGSTASTFFLVTLVMFILRGVLFAKKIENRETAIEEYELYQAKLNKEPKQR